MAITSGTAATAVAGRLYQKVFTSSGTLVLPAGYGASNPLTVEAFVVAGGGGAGRGLSDATNTVVAGGGGGAGVVKGLLTLTGDATVQVGLGGAQGVGSTTAGSGGNGQCSFIGQGTTVANMWHNPQCYGPQAGIGTLLSNFWSFGPGGNAANPVAPSGAASFASRGGYMMTFSTSATRRFNSQPFRVTAGSTYTLSFYYSFNSSNTACTITPEYFRTDTGAWIGAGTASAIADQTTFLGSRQVLTFTVPANADAVSFALAVAAPSTLLNTANWQLESGGTANTYADGDTSGYAWAGGIKEAGETLNVSGGNYLAAIGGGGGAGSGSSTATAATTTGPHIGATSGGGLIVTANANAGASALAYGGHGGGAAGPALPPGGTITAVGPPVPYSLAGSGSVGATQPAATGIRSAPGPGIDGYGRGGWGMMPNFPIQMDSRMLGWNAPNSGMGGSAMSQWESPVDTPRANPGGSGLVIVRYWA